MSSSSTQNVDSDVSADQMSQVVGNTSGSSSLSSHGRLNKRRHHGGNNSNPLSNSSVVNATSVGASNLANNSGTSGSGNSSAITNMTALGVVGGSAGSGNTMISGSSNSTSLLVNQSSIGGMRGGDRDKGSGLDRDRSDRETNTNMSQNVGVAGAGVVALTSSSTNFLSPEHELDDILAEWANMTGFLSALGSVWLPSRQVQQKHATHNNYLVSSSNDSTSSLSLSTVSVSGSNVTCMSTVASSSQASNASLNSIQRVNQAWVNLINILGHSLCCCVI